MRRIILFLLLAGFLATPAWAGKCDIPAGGQCSLVMDPAPAPVEVVNLGQDKEASVLGWWLYSVQGEPRRVAAVLKPGEAALFAPPKSKDGQGDSFAARTLVIFNLGTTDLSARTVK
jgi:hypothetical protein